MMTAKSVSVIKSQLEKEMYVIITLLCRGSTSDLTRSGHTVLEADRQQHRGDKQIMIAKTLSTAVHYIVSLWLWVPIQLFWYCMGITCVFNAVVSMLFCSNALRVTRSAALEGIDNTGVGSGNTYIGKQGKDFEFSHVTNNISLVECSCKQSTGDEASLETVQDWIKGLF